MELPPHRASAKLELSPDHFHPAFVKQRRGKTVPVSDRAPQGEEISRPSKLAHPALNGALVQQFATGSRKVLTGVLAGAGRAMRWSGEQSRQAAGNFFNLAAPRLSPTDALSDLADAGRYTAVSNRLAAATHLSDREETSLRYNTPDRRIHQTGSDFAVEGDFGPAPLFIASGWACRTRSMRNGRCQIVGFILPGDLIGLHAAHTSLSHTSIMALTTVETVSATAVMDMADKPSQYPGITAALEKLRAQDEEFLVNQVVRLATSSGEERVAHLLLELQWRLQQAGLANSREFPMPLSDAEIGSAVNLAPRAARKTLDCLRRRNLLRSRYGRAEIVRSDYLSNMSGFRPPASELPPSYAPVSVNRTVPAAMTGAPRSGVGA